MWVQHWPVSVTNGDKSDSGSPFEEGLTINFAMGKALGMFPPDPYCREIFQPQNQ